MADTNELNPADIVYRPKDFREHFDTTAYLQDFYSKADNEPAMKIVIYFLPSLATRIPKGAKVLDVGSGPTVHVVMCLRNVAAEVYLSDYLEQNRAELLEWMADRSRFNWNAIAKYIAELEGEPLVWDKIEPAARPKLKGVYTCDIHTPAVIAQPHVGPFDVVTTFFCIEYACESLEQYMTAVYNVAQLIRTDGYLLMAGIMEETWCKFGGKKYSCFYLTEETLFAALRNAHIDTRKITYYLHEGIFVVFARKMDKAEVLALEP